MPNNDHEDVLALTRRLAAECVQAGLNATLLGAKHVQVSAPGAHARLAETVRCEPGDADGLVWRWSWGDPICPAANIAEAVRIIAYVVTPAVRTR